jgi:uncharacterized protein YndB with AHSA1/START domain
MFDIVHELTIDASQERVFEAVTTSEGIAGWWTTDVAVAGDPPEVEVGFEEGRMRMRFRSDEFEPPVLARLTCVAGPDEWPNTQLAFTLLPEPEGPGTVLRLWHGNWEYEDGILPSVSFQWAMYLDSLRRHLEKGEGSPAR